jgi:hypothetical protein
MTVQIKTVTRDQSNSETPAIQNDLHAEAVVSLLRGSRGLIGSLSPEQLRALGEMPEGPTQEIGRDDR